MPDIQKLKELSVDDLLQELRAREAKAGQTCSRRTAGTE